MATAIRTAGLVFAALGVLVSAAGCGAQSPTDMSTAPVTGATSTAATPTADPGTVSQFDPRWIGLTAPQSWTESDRRITGESQEFGLRPVDENEVPRLCNGCGVDPPTAFLTAYAPGAFDPAEVLSAGPVTVGPGIEGYLLPSRGSADAVLAWRYADDAWATVRGRTTITSEGGRMLELARALRPADRTPIRVPLSIAGVPAPMSLAEIYVDRGQYGTTLRFGGCTTGDRPDCYNASVQIWPADDFSGLIEEEGSTPTMIGGRAGILAGDGNTAAARVGPGLLVVFSVDAVVESGGPPAITLPDLLAKVAWAPDPADAQTWRPVAEWAKPD